MMQWGCESLYVKEGGFFFYEGKMPISFKPLTMCLVTLNIFIEHFNIESIV